MVCHMCENGTDFYCEKCEEPVCEDCCVVPTYHNQIDYSLCTECGDMQEVERYEEAAREHKIEEEIKTKKKKQNEARKANYWKPENVEKRRVAKIENKRLAIEQAKKMMKEAAQTVNSMFRGM